MFIEVLIGSMHSIYWCYFLVIAYHGNYCMDENRNIVVAIDATDHA